MKRDFASFVVAAGVSSMALCCTDSEERPTAPPVTVPPAAAAATAPTDAPTAVTDDGPPWPRDPPPFPNEQFTAMRVALGAWRHSSAASDRYRMQEIISGGVALFDADGDGDLDLFCNTGGCWPDLPAPPTPPQHAFFRNDGEFVFTELARDAGLLLPSGAFAIGAATADFDNDGDQDLYVTGDRRSWLYRNDGVREGVARFVECGAQLGVDAAGLLASSATFLDIDRDGRLDLYVAGYVDFSDELNERLRCGVATTGVRDYCSPKDFPGTQDRLFHQEADGRFRECAREVGLLVPEPLAKNGKGLGVVACDLDDDGDCDLYVANDGCPNLLFLNDGAGHFTEEGLLRGGALSSDGRSQAGMGTDAADYDGDGDFDLWVTNLDLETNGLYRNDGTGYFEDEVRESGLAALDQGAVGFGTLFLDFDHDADLDLVVANGHVVRHIWKTRGTLTLRQHDQLFENVGDGRFRGVAAEQAGAHFLERHVARGLASGDVDGDGDLDVVIACSDDRPQLLRNQHAERTHASDAVIIELRGTTSARDAIGACAWFTCSGKTQLATVKGGASYASASDRRLHFALPSGATHGTLKVRWPDGKVQEFGSLAAGFDYRATEAGTLEALRPFAKR